MGRDMQAQLHTCIAQLRPYIISKGGEVDDEPTKSRSTQWLFTSKGSHENMNHSSISKALTRSFRTAGIKLGIKGNNSQLKS